MPPKCLMEPYVPNIKYIDVLVNNFVRKNLKDKEMGQFQIRWILKYVFSFLSSFHKEWGKITFYHYTKNP